MLSSRYLHLHEALGLGPMWLKQGARVRTSTAPNSPTSQSNPKHHPSTPAQPMRTLSVNAHQARMATLATVQNRPSEKHPPTSIPTPKPNAPTSFPTLFTPPENIAINATIAPVMIVSICPAPEDMLHGTLFSGEVGILLGNMLAAIGLSNSSVHKTSWIQGAPTFSSKPEMSAIEANLTRMQAELAASQARAVVLLGNIFEQAELTPMITALCQEVPHFILPHPARLLRQPQLKAQAWHELKKLRALLQSPTLNTFKQN